MSVAPYTRRIPKFFEKTITFDGTTFGDVGTDTIATITGRVLIVHGGVYCSTLLTGAGTLELGFASNTAALIAQTTATAIDADEWWQDATPELKGSPAIVNQLVSADIILTTASATVTAGVLVFGFYWLPMSSSGNMA